MPAFPPLAATGIGSVPFADPKEAVALILKYLPEVPFWPQMVRQSFREDMVAQGVRGLPGLQVDEALRAVTVDPRTSREIALAEFYEAVWGEEFAPFALDPAEAGGFFSLLAQVAGRPDGPQALKGQVVGPVTFAGMVKDANDKPILYDREMTQAVSLGLARKAAWQAQQFRDLGREAVIFFDEPILTGFGSAFFPVSREDVITMLTDALEALRQAGPVGLGIHCCGNTEWSLLLDLPIDFLSFDAYGYFENLTLYDRALRQYLDRGGWLAWGLVPTGDELKGETAQSLWDRFQSQVLSLGEKGLPPREVLSRLLLTPACGLGYLSPDVAEQALAFLAELSQRARRWLAEL